MRPIRETLKSILQEKQTRQSILDDIETAKTGKDLKTLTDLIEKAKLHNIAGTCYIIYV